MKGILSTLALLNEKRLKRSGLNELDGIAYVREKMFLSTLQIILIFGLFAYIPGVIHASYEKYWLAAGFDTFAYFSLLAMYFNVSIPTRLKVFYLLGMIYVLGIILFIVMGASGPGLIWLVGFSILAAIFLGMKSALYTILINILTIVVLGVGIRIKIFDLPFFNEYTIVTWLSVAINLIVVNAISTFSLVYFIQGLEKSLLIEQELKSKLKKKSERLISAKAKAEESDQLKSAFLANVSHEFRTPMNSILGFTEIMLYTETDEEKRKRYLENIQKSGEQLLHIIHNTIEYSKIEMGTIDLDPTTLGIREILQVIYEQHKTKCPKDLKFNYLFIDDGKERMIVTDKDKFNQVFSNLITNAFKFTNKGHISFGNVESAHDDFYKFFVSDTGIGIRNEKQKDIFTRFHKEDDFKEGTGLGLSISATLIAHMGGRIWLNSEPNKGTTFYFLLPKQLVIRKY